MKNLILLLALSICFANTTSAQWQPTENILGGVVANLTVGGSTVFSVVGGSVFTSVNNGNDWVEKSNGLSNVRTLAVDGTSIFAGTSTNGVYLSTDNGNTWRAVNTGLTQLNVISLAVNGTNIFAGTTNGIFLSTDNGGNWRAVNNGLTSFFVNNLYINAIAVKGNTVFVSSNNSVFSSTDSGNNWTDIGAGLIDLRGNPFVAVNELLVNGDKVYAATFNGIFVLTNNDTSWVPIGLQNTNVISLTANGTTVFAGSTNGVYISANGSNWTLKNTGINRLSVNALAIIGTTVLVGTNGSVFTSQDNGNNWNTKNNGLKKVFSSLWGDDRNIYASSNNTLYVLANDGTTWTETNYYKTLSTNVTDLYTNGTNIFAASFEGVYFSSNKGENWVAQNNGLTSSIGVPFLLSITSNGSSLFALSGVNAKIFKSTNNGNTWTGINTDFGNRLITRLRSSGANLYAFGIRFDVPSTGGLQTSDDVFLSTDNGNNWREILTTNGSVSSLVTKGANTFVGTNEGIFLSTNNGNNWAEVTNNLPTSTPALGSFNLATSGNFLFTTVGNKGVYLSTNNGNSWRAANEGLNNSLIYKLVVNGNYLFATTENGIFRRLLSDFNALSINEVDNASCTLSPNPVSNQLTINCSNELIGQEYAIYNILGKTMTSNILTENSTVVSLGKVPNGVYLLTIIGTSKTIKFVKQ